MTTPLYRELASLMEAYIYCSRSEDANESQREWAPRHLARINALIGEFMPSGSGFDNGTQLDEASHGEALCFDSAYHKMDDVGQYDGWLKFKVVVRPSLQHSILLDLRGLSHDDEEEHGDYIIETFDAALRKELDTAAFYTARKL